MNETGRTPFKGLTTSRHHQALRRVLVFQLLLTLLSPCLLYVTAGMVAAYSGLIGGLIYLIPTSYQLRHIFAPDNSNNIRQTLRGLYKSEIWKMALTAVLFGVAFSIVRPLEPFPLFGVFVLLQLMAWIGPVIGRHPARSR